MSRQRCTGAGAASRNCSPTPLLNACAQSPTQKHGPLAGDLGAFVLQYSEEMGSPVGRAPMRDVLAERILFANGEPSLDYVSRLLECFARLNGDEQSL